MNIEQALKVLTCLVDDDSTEQPEPSATASSAHAALIGERVLVRTRISGVSIGTLTAVTVEGGIISATLADSWRCWSWTGDALATSTISLKGAKFRTERNPVMFIMSDQGAEIHPMTAEAWEYTMANKTVGPK